MSEQTDFDSLYLSWHNNQQYTNQISKAVWYLGAFRGFGPIWGKQILWRKAKWEKIANPCTPPYQIGVARFRTQEWQEKALDAALTKLEKLGNLIVFSTTASYYSQFQSACLLKDRGFKLLGGKCYKHPGYRMPSDSLPQHPGIPDRYVHWEHVWYRVIGEPEEIGLPDENNQMNNCGVDSRFGLESIQKHDIGRRAKYLCVAWLARGTTFPKGWKRFYSAQDYKLGVNLDLTSAQVCEHDFDLKIFDGWEPDFEQWVPA